MKMKRLAAAVLTGAMALSLLVGCGGGNGSTSGGSQGGSTSGGAAETTGPMEAAAIDMNEEPYTVAIQINVLPGTALENEEKVEAAVNEIILPAINCKVDMQVVWISEIANTTSLGIAGGEKLDLIHVGTVQPLSKMVGSDMLYDMNTDNLLQTHGQKLMELFADTLASGNVNGRQLAIPAQINVAAAKGIGYNKTMMDAAGVTIPEQGSFDDLEQALIAFHEANPDVIAFYQGSGGLNKMYWLQGYDGFGTECSYGAILDATKDTTVVNYYATDEFREYVKRMYKWRSMGLIEKDSTDTTSTQEYMAALQVATDTVDQNPKQNADRGSTAIQNGYEYATMQMVAPRITTAAVTEYMWGIAINCARPDKAMDFLNYLYTDEKVANLIKYGIEGENYTVVGNNVIESNGTYLTNFHNAGDDTRMYALSPAPENFQEQWAEFNKNATVSPILGYMFDDSDYQTESSVISNAIAQYLPTLQNGIFESEDAAMAYLDEFIKALESAGINDVIAGNQAQLDAWIAANK